MVTQTKVIDYSEEGKLTRRIYVNVPDVFKQFVAGSRIIPAEYFHEKSHAFYIRNIHEVGEVGWADGGVDAKDDAGTYHCFYLDSIILHPKGLKTRLNIIDESISYAAESEVDVYVSKRGRPKSKSTEITDVELKVPGRRGRPAMLPELRKTQPRDPSLPKGKRGRKKMDPALLKPKVVKVSTGGKRGRPKMNPALLKPKPIIVSTGLGRGRPKKVNS